MEIELGLVHYIFTLFMFLVLGFMIKKKDTSVICILGVFLLGLASTKSLHMATIGVFDSFIYAINELLGTILIISIMVATGKIMARTGVNEVIINPLLKFVKNENLAYWIIGIIMMTVSWFFWPSPAIALIGIILLPVAIKAGLPRMGAAIAMNIFGHGIALSSDYIIQAAPKITADAAGLTVGEVTRASVPLVITMGLVTTITSFIMLKRDMKRGNIYDEESYRYEISKKVTNNKISIKMKKILAIITLLLFTIDIYIMLKYQLQGGVATALIGGTSIFLLILFSLLEHGNQGLEETTSYLVEGFQFGFKIFGVVVPIAAFFYLGDVGFIEILGEKLPNGSFGIVNDLGIAISNTIPLNKVSGTTITSLVGIITGLDGSGFSGISLVGSVSKIFSTSIGSGGATLTALGQISGIWVGGGTLVPWALIPVAAICDIDPFELARKNLIPVSVGLTITTVVAMILL